MDESPDVTFITHNTALNTWQTAILIEQNMKVC
jgi:hypothetical protein